MKGGEKMSFIIPLASWGQGMGLEGEKGLFISALHLSFWEMEVILIFLPQNTS